MAGCDQGKMKGYHLNSRHLELVGEIFAKTLIYTKSPLINKLADELSKMIGK